jgi:hypothetical protein
VICSGIAVGSASTVIAGDVLEDTAFADTGGLIGSLQLDRDLRLDLLVEANLETVDVENVAAHGVVLLLLDHHRSLGPIQLEVEQGVALGEEAAQLAGRNLEGASLAALPVDDSGHHPLSAQPTGGPRAEHLTM